ncbi:MAG: hypothetical protein AB3N17_00250 [Tateyamaria sp.]
MYVSITGLKLKRVWHQPLFWRHAVASMTDAMAAPGNLSAESRTIDGVHHTLSTWTSRADMLSYLRSKRHARAMRRFDGIATGRVCGFEADARPTWSQALARYHADGRDVYRTD